MRYAISVLTLLLLTTACIGFAHGEDKPLTREAAKALFDKADRALNEAWAATKKALSEEEFAKLKEDQHAWVEYRDYLARSSMFTGADVQGELSLDAPEYLQAAAGLEDERTEWLKGLIHEWKEDGLTGAWSDSRGGSIQIVEKNRHLYFAVTCTRGPTSHSGDLSGVAVWNSPIGWFSDKGLDKDKPDETNLSFVMSDKKLQITGANTGHYHGARAYFDGSYVRVKSLTPQEQAVVIKEAKSGEAPQQ